MPQVQTKRATYCRISYAVLCLLGAIGLWFQSPVYAVVLVCVGVYIGLALPGHQIPAFALALFLVGYPTTFVAIPYIAAAIIPGDVIVRPISLHVIIAAPICAGFLLLGLWYSFRERMMTMSRKRGK